MKKFCLLIVVLVVGIFTMTGCSSFDSSGLENTLNGYFDWFESVFNNTGNSSGNSNNGNNDSNAGNEDSSNNGNNDSNAGNEDNSNTESGISVILDKNSIIF